MSNVCEKIEFIHISVFLLFCFRCQYDDFGETDLDLVTDQPVNIKIKIEDTPGLKTIPKHKTTEEKETAVFKETSVDQETKNVNSSEPQVNETIIY